MKQFLTSILFFFLIMNAYAQCSQCPAGSVQVTGSTSINNQNTAANYCVYGTWSGTINPVLANGSTITFCPTATWNMPANTTIQNNVTIKNYGSIVDGVNNYSLTIQSQANFYNQAGAVIDINFFENQEGDFFNYGQFTTKSMFLHGSVINVGSINITASCGGNASTSCGFYIGNKSIDLNNSGTITFVDGNINDGIIGGGIINSTGKLIINNNGDNTLNTLNLHNLTLQNTNTLANGTFKINGNFSCNNVTNNASVCLQAGATQSCNVTGNPVTVCAAPLPVKLVSFDKMIVNQQLLFQWESESEINFSHYNLQQSTDGQNFETIETIKALGIAGFYQSSYLSQREGLTYYRLQGIDFDGQTEHFKILTHIKKQDEKGLVLYPSPATQGNQLNIILPESEGYIISIYDMNGMKIHMQLLDEIENVSIPLTDKYRNGEYILEAVNANAVYRKSLQYYNKGIVGFILLLCHVTFVASGQTFDGTTGQIIDFNNEAVPTVFNIDVSLTQQKIDQTYGLERVCIDINHKRASDLKIELISPDGTTFWLSNRNGEENRYGYFNTCFSANGFDGYIYDAKYNLEGTFTPEGKMDFVNNSQNPNGRWFLSVTDLRNGVIGKVRSISLTFGNNPAFSSAGPCSFASPKNCYSSPLSNGELLPDLIVVPALTTGHIKYYRPNDPDTLNRNQLRFAAAMANVGEGPFEIHSGQIWKCGDSIVNKTDRCQDGNLPSATVYQQIYIKKGEEMKMDAHPGGHLYFDNSPGHNHYHVADWVDFVLLKKRWWTGNPLKWKVVAKSTKVSYCLFDNLNCNAQNNYCQEKTINHTEHTLQNYGFGHFASCESAKQGISVGGIDYYGINYEGQSILLPSDIKKGEYSLMIHIDPLKKYREKSTANNIFITEVIID